MAVVVPDTTGRLTGIRSRMTAALRRWAQVLPANNPIRQNLSRCWDRVLESTGRHVTVCMSGRPLRVQVGLRHLDPDYERAALRVWLSLIRPGDTVWDVGANIGIYSLLAGQQVGPCGRVVAWEPGPLTHGILQDHIAANGLEERIVAIQAAVADKEGGTVPFAVAPGAEPDSTNRIGHAKNGCTVEVPVGTLDGWMDRLGSAPRLLKIDIEGAELLALRGASRLLGPGGQRPAVLLAVHPMFLPEFDSSPQDIETLLHEYEYDCRDVGGRSCSPTEYAEYVCLPREHSSDFSVAFGD